MQEPLIINRLRSELFRARKEKNATERDFLTTLLSAVVAVGKDRGNRETTQQEAEAIVKKFLKTNKEFQEILPEDKQEMRLKLKQEEEWLLSYLPRQLSEEKLSEIIKPLLEQSKGEIMKHLKLHYGNSFDAKATSILVDRLKS
jgi:uncharacterized protein YqeY